MKEIENVTDKPLRGQMDIFKYIEKPRGYVANERSVKKRKSTIPGQINMFEYMDLRETEIEKQRMEAIQRSELEQLPGQMDILMFLAQPEAPVKAPEPISETAEPISEGSEGLQEADELRRIEALFETAPERTAPVTSAEKDRPAEMETAVQGPESEAAYDDEDLLILAEGSLNLGKIMRILHISATEAEQVRSRLLERGQQ